MRRLKLLSSAAVLFVGLPCAMASGQTADAIAADFNQRWMAAVNERDLAKVMALFDGDAFVVDETISNIMPANRTELEETVRSLFAGMKSVSLVLRPKRSAFLKPDVILTQGTWEANPQRTDAPPSPPVKGFYVVTLAKGSGGWNAVAEGSIVPPLPAR